MSRALRFASWLTGPIRRLLAEDRVVATIAVAFGLSELVTLVWDLPGSHGWDNDGIAPRDLFGGLADNLTPGRTHQYPLLPYLVLGVACLPILLAAALFGPLDAAAVRERILSVPCMTGISVVAKLLAAVLACLALVVLARIVRRTHGARAGRIAALFAATNLTFAFYGRVSNLDVPYVAVTLLALDRLLDIVERGTRRSYVAFGVLAAAAVSTKDQAYAAFVLVAPLYLVVLPLVRRDRFAPDHFRRLLRAGGIALAAYAIMSGALFNPTGFVKRLGVLRGPASQDWRTYSRDPAGLLANLKDTFASQPTAFWPLPLLVLVWSFAVVAIVRPPGRTLLFERAPRALPLVAGLSSYVFFTLAVGRSEHRFLLPIGCLLSAYGGVAGDMLLSLARSTRAQGIIWLGLGAALAWAGLRSSAAHLTQLGDARNRARELLAHVPRGTVVETYGLLVYQPHFDVSETSRYRVERVGPEPPNKRNPLVGAREVQAEIADVGARRPDVLVLTGGFANSYLAEQRDASRPLSAVVRERRKNADTVEFVHQATSDALPGYRLVARLNPALPRFASALGLRPLAIHATIGLPVWVLVRRDGRARALEPAPPPDVTRTIRRESR
ncbi:MAG TPA: glycosyltransferase family 39 protein [Polyangiaceae bacterium]